MKKKLIAALYEQGFHESVVDSIVDNIYSLVVFSPKDMKDSAVKDLLQNMIEAFQETIKE